MYETSALRACAGQTIRDSKGIVEHNQAMLTHKPDVTHTLSGG